MERGTLNYQEKSFFGIGFESMKILGKDQQILLSFAPVSVLILNLPTKGCSNLHIERRCQQNCKIRGYTNCKNCKIRGYTNCNFFFDELLM